MKKSSRSSSQPQPATKLTKENEQVIRYWRDAIAESERSEVKERRNGALDLPKNDLLQGRCSPSMFGALMRAIQEERRGDRTYRDLDPNSPLPVLIAPIQMRREPGSMSGIGAFEPLWIPAFLDPSGRLRPPLQGEPWIPRTVLEPITEDQYPAIGKIDDQNAFVEKAQTGRFSNWLEYWEFADALFKAVTGSAIFDFKLKGYNTRPTSLLTPDSTGSGSLNPIRDSYDRILDGEQHAGLLPAFARKTPTKKQILIESPRFISNAANKHCAQFGNKFPLAPSQRRAVHQALSLRDGEFLCVTGPPGTGKTTLLQSIVASLWVQAIVNERSVPPVIVATGATNQAVTNVITAMERGTADDSLLAQRWIPYVNSYGTFCVSNTKAESATAFQIELRSGDGFSGEREQWNFVSEATRYYLSCYKAAFAQDVPLLAAVRNLAKLVVRGRGELYRQIVLRRDGTSLEWLKSLVGLHPKKSADQFFSELADFDPRLRYETFLYGARFWEGRWLLEMQDELTRRDRVGDNKPAKRFRTDDWRRRAMLTPTFVSTLAMLPRFFPHDRKKTPLRPPIDFLIFDEASQITPEVGAGALSFASRAVIVGDGQQLEPVWSVLPHVDRANCTRHGLLGKDTDVAWRGLNDQGVLSSSGSLMKLGIRCSKYDDGRSTIGVFLSEQRRSVPEIMAVSNALAYRGRLQPHRAAIPYRIFPALGYVQVSGRSERQGTSRLNRLEAEQIIAWILHNRERLLAFYQCSSLDDVVAVISPFAAQIDYLRRKLRERVADNILVGTVNSLQGAERSVVLFSTVYDTRHLETYFFDRSPNMLNVAVSRAKDSFILFGEMAIFNRQQDLPSSIVSHFVVREGNELEAPLLPEPEVTVEKSDAIFTLDQHRKLLRETIAEARRKVIIISPQISMVAIQADRLPQLIQDAVARGVHVRIYTDATLDMEKDDSGLLKFSTAMGRQLLVDAGADLVVVSKIHLKTLSKDDNFYTTGSFNWLSAVRDVNSDYQRTEQTGLHWGSKILHFIRETEAELEYRGFVDQRALVARSLEQGRRDRPGADEERSNWTRANTR